MTYEDIFGEIDALFTVLQILNDTLKVLERRRLEFDRFHDRFEHKCRALGLTATGRIEPVRDGRRQVFFNILDNISDQVKAMFENFGELAFLVLVDCKKFNEMSQHFDDTKLQSLSKYARFFDFVRLKAVLIGLYSSETVRNECKSPGQLLSFLPQNDLIQKVPEASKLLQLLLTVPVTTASVETSFYFCLLFTIILCLIYNDVGFILC